jgi:hypothetical protein
MKKPYYILLLFIIILGIIYSLNVFFPNRAEDNMPVNKSRYCVFGAAVKVPGIDLLQTDTVIVCDCLGKVIHGQSRDDCSDCDYYSCDGEVNYSCYRLPEGSDMIPIGNKGYESKKEYYGAMGQEIPCPPNKYISSPSTN